MKLLRYAGAGVPVYWIIDVSRRLVEVHQKPRGRRKKAGYQERSVYEEGQEFAVVLDGREIGRLAVSDLLPARPSLEK